MTVNSVIFYKYHGELKNFECQQIYYLYEKSYDKIKHVFSLYHYTINCIAPASKTKVLYNLGLDNWEMCFKILHQNICFYLFIYLFI